MATQPHVLSLGIKYGRQNVGVTGQQTQFTNRYRRTVGEASVDEFFLDDVVIGDDQQIRALRLAVARFANQLSESIRHPLLRCPTGIGVFAMPQLAFFGRQRRGDAGAGDLVELA